MKTITALSLILFVSTICISQGGINYKAVIKDGGGNIVADTPVALQFQIIETSETGTVIYEENHTPTTDANGLVILTIGDGTPISGFFSAIDWGADDHFLNVQVSIGAGLVDMGTTQFMSVPYALYAQNVKGLEPLDEGNGIGHRIIGRNLNNLGDIGLNAVDLSGSPIASATYGATGEYSVAMNRQTTAQGDFSTAMGLDSKAYGNTSFVMGFNTIANGYDATAMGAYTTADASQSLAIGRYNVGGGNNEFWNANDPVFEVGIGTGSTTKANALTVLKNGKIGIGISPTEDFHLDNAKSALFGTSTQGSGDKLMWLPSQKAFRAGGVTTTNWNTPAIGEYSFASGLNTIAEGYGSFAVGNRSWARNLYSFASGFFTNAHGAYSTAMGFNTDATAPYSSAFGYLTDATGDYATSMGHNTRAQSYASTAMGRYNIGGGTANSWQLTDPLFEIGNGTSAGARSNALTVLKNGNVGIGNEAPDYRLQLNGDFRMDGDFRLGPGLLRYQGGNNIASGSHIIPTSDSSYRLGSPTQRWQSVHAVVGTIQTSDLRLKTNIKNLEYGLGDIMKLRPVSFNWKDNPDRDSKLGLIAQDLLKVIPEVVHTETFMNTNPNDPSKGEYQAVDELGVFYSDIIPVLIKGMQDQQQLIEDQQQQITELKKMVQNLLHTSKN